MVPPNDLLPGGGPPSPPTPTPEPSVPPRTTKPITCEFCECSLAPSGDVMRMSDVARTYRDQAETIDRLRASAATLESDIAALRRELSEARAAVPTPRKGIFGS